MLYATTDSIDPGQECRAAVPVDATPNPMLQALLSAWGCESDVYESPLEPSRASFFELPMLEQLHRKPYHSIAVDGPFDLKALVNDHRAQLFRSEARLNEKAKPRLDRLLFNLGDGVFGFYDCPSPTQGLCPNPGAGGRSGPPVPTLRPNASAEEAGVSFAAH
jgi:hypothetical protein